MDSHWFSIGFRTARIVTGFTNGFGAEAAKHKENKGFSDVDDLCTESISLACTGHGGQQAMVVGHRAFSSPGGIAVHEGHASGSRKSRVPVITMLVPMIAGCVAGRAAFG